MVRNGIVLLLVISVLGCTPRPKPPENTPEAKGLPLLQVGEVVVFESELNDRIQKIEEKYPRKYSTFNQKKDLLKEMAGIELLYQKALEENFDKKYEFKSRMVDLYVEAIAADAKEKLKEEEIRSVYESSPQVFDQVSARHILFRTPPKMSAADQSKKKQALEEIRKELLKDPEAFPTKARQVSEDGTRAQGGELGFFTKQMMVGPFSEAAFKLRSIGEISPIVKTEFGFHIIQLTGDRRGFEFHKDRIKDRYVLTTQRKRLEKELKELRGDNDYVYFDENIRKITPLPEIINKEVEVKEEDAQIMLSRWFKIIGLFFVLGCQTNIHENESIARVNGQVISVRDYLDLFDSIKPKEHSLDGVERSKIKNLVIKTLVRRQIILDAAKEANIKPSDKELEAALKEYQQENSSTIFEESLLEGMIDEEEWKKRVSQTLIMERLFESRNVEIEKPTIQEALDYYQENARDFSRKAECTAKHLVVEDQTLAKDLEKKIKKNPQQFNNLAREYSIGPEAKEDALITVEKDIMPEKIDNFLFDSKKGEISGVIRTSYGFHILKTIRCRSAVNFAFEQVKKEIYSLLREKKKRLWLQKFEETLIRQAAIEYNRKLIQKL